MRRRINRARRRAVRWGSVSGSSAAGAAGLAIASGPVWLMDTAIGVGVGTAIPAALATRTYLRLRRTPLPVARVSAPLPPAGSQARAPMQRLHELEHSLAEVVPVIARQKSLDSRELAETTAAAAEAGNSLRSIAADIVAVEAASMRVGGSPDVDAHLRTAVAALNAGLSEFERMVAAAARVGAQGLANRPAWNAPDTELGSAADRLSGWAQALAELGPGYGGPQLPAGPGGTS